MSLEQKTQDRETVIGIIGLGYVGIPLVLSFHNAGFEVIGFDIDEGRVSGLNNGRSPIKHISSDSIAQMCAERFTATTDMARISDVDAIIICVPTPLNKFREPDLSFVTGTMDAIIPFMRAGQLLSLESTTWPGTTEEVLRPYLDKAGFTVGEDCFLVYSPEREDPGNPDFPTSTIPKVIGGATPACLAAGEALYSTIIERVVPVSSPKAAEMVKLLENIHRSVNIGLVNEMKIVAERMGLDIFEIIDAAKTKPFGFTAYYPGPGIGGHCIPIDPFYLTWKAREFGLHTRFIELAGEVNAAMPDYVVGTLTRALNARGKAVMGARLLALGISYKRDVDDTRESPAVLVMERLRDLGAEIAYSDPYVPVFPKMREHRFDLSSVPLTPDTLKGYDAALLLTDHTGFDYEMIREHAPLIIDTRGKFREASDKIIRS